MGCFKTTLTQQLPSSNSAASAKKSHDPTAWCILFFMIFSSSKTAWCRSPSFFKLPTAPRPSPARPSPAPPHILQARELEGRRAHAPRQRASAVQEVNVTQLGLALVHFGVTKSSYDFYDVLNDEKKWSKLINESL